MKQVPVLETERLILREMIRADFPAFAQSWRDPEVVRFILPEPRHETASWRAFQANAGSWAMDGIGQWAITLRATSDYIGQTGFFDAKRGFGPDFDSAPECGWVLARPFWGQGYASEAVAEAHRWFDQRSFPDGSRAIITSGHVASEAIARSNGYIPMRHTQSNGDHVVLYRRQ